MINLRNKKLTYLLIFATVLTMLALRYFDGFLTNEICPNGIVTFEFVKDVEQAKSILNSWDEEAKIAAALSLGLDYLFMILYSSTLALFIFKIHEKFAANSWFRKLGRLLIGCVFLAAIFDAIENFALIKLLLADLREIWPTTASVSATLKFLILAMALLYLVLAGLKRVFGKSKRK